MRVAAIQSSFIPWRGYFDIIASVDAFIFLDDVQYTPRDWRSRNKIKTSNGTEWVTVPVIHGGRDMLVREAKIDNSRAWKKKILGSLVANYGRSEYYELARDLLGVIEDEQFDSLSNLNIILIKNICKFLSIKTELFNSTEFDLVGQKTDRLIDLLKKNKATTYLSGPSADAYLDKNSFRENGICLEYKSYDYKPYLQLWGGFDGAVTVLDLIANCGPEAINYFRSGTPDKVIVDARKK